jgi:GH24 family phage-related lysozyme (muramidase)
MTEILDEKLEGSNVRPAPPEGEEEPPERERGADEEPFDAEADTRGPGARKLSKRGAAFIGRFEGLRLELYNDPAGHCTIGIGHLVHHGRCDGSEPAEFKRGITRERAFELLEEDAAEVVAAIRRRVGVLLTQPRFDALCSWGFNCGSGVFVTSTLVRKLNAGDFASVRSELARWDKAGNPPRPLAGLTRRRRAEGRLFAEGKYE